MAKISMDYTTGGTESVESEDLHAWMLTQDRFKELHELSEEELVEALEQGEDEAERVAIAWLEDRVGDTEDVTSIDVI